jgi:hypothetical protein
LLDLRVGIFDSNDRERVVPLTRGFRGGIVGMDGNERHGHLIINTVSVVGYTIIGMPSVSEFDDTVRQAPLHAFNQAGILDVLNRNTVHPNNPNVIFAGSFMFAEDERNSDYEGNPYVFPSGIAGLLGRGGEVNE